MATEVGSLGMRQLMGHCNDRCRASSQANDACKCNGWKNPNPPTAPRMDLQQPVTNLSEPCRSCGHALGNSRGTSRARRAPGTVLIPWSHRGFLSGTADHVSHLENVSEEEINRLLGMVVDVENLFMSVHKEEDTDTKQVYFYLFKVRLGVCMSHCPAHGGTCAEFLVIVGAAVPSVCALFELALKLGL